MLIKVILTLVGLLVGAGVMFPVAVNYRKRTAEKEIGSAEEEAKRIINESIKSAENKKREMMVEAKEEIHRSRTEYDKEVKDRRSELQKQERRIQQKEETLDRKTEQYERKDEELSRRLAKVATTQEEVSDIKRAQLEMLEKISGMSTDEAKEYLLKNVESEVRHETAMKIKEVQTQLKDEAEQKAREIIATAIQRCAADHAAEATISVVALPNDEMKGRIIGREGRNIRALETMTGVDLIIDDTPEAITLSSFDPVRREIARMSTGKADCRRPDPSHPTLKRWWKKPASEVELTIKQEGERATFESWCARPCIRS